MSLPSATPPLRVLVVDDSALYRKVVRAVLEQLPNVEVIGHAQNGRLALERIIADRPDAITLDMEMPELDGLGLLRELSERQLPLAAIMISTLTAAGAQATSQALQLGAFDFVLKPTLPDMAANERQLRADLAPRIEACRTLRRGGRPSARPLPIAPPRAPSAALRRTPELIGIGVSTGGPVALNKLLPLLGPQTPPLVIVQHMPPIFTKTLADDLNRRCQLEVVEGYHGMTVQRGRAIIAPGGKQMRIARDQRRTFVQITDDPPERNCRPAVDYLFRSIAAEYGPKAWGAILTGMGDDGTLGCQAMKERGAAILAQDEATCVVYGMPRAVAEAGLVDVVGPLETIAARINESSLVGASA
ncbi:MAG: chemotaxis response regulator protein-glutamate methylesterase [Planctomycetaceae bacterium]|jgi:two-component system chemotaxis response regulator CheB|nr:chemotaxis response regulator protein-glutamate methylesterase [Planctomycetaceae bacterium]